MKKNRRIGTSVNGVMRVIIQTPSSCQQPVVTGAGRRTGTVSNPVRFYCPCGRRLSSGSRSQRFQVCGSCQRKGREWN